MVTVVQQQPLLGYLQQQAVHPTLPLLAEQTSPYFCRCECGAKNNVKLKFEVRNDSTFQEHPRCFAINRHEIDLLEVDGWHMYVSSS